MTLGQRLSLAFAVLTGRYSPPDETETEMELQRVKEQVGELTAALSRAAADKSADEATIAQVRSDNSTLQTSNADLQQQLADAENQIVELLQPVVDQANALAPPPQA